MPAASCQVKDVIKRSRFTTEIARASTIEDARAFVDRVRAADPGATHHCWAYVVGPPGSTARVGFSDDGEPHGTAGQPMLTALLHSSVGDVVAVCTRHYGGVKLGTGGLARAYSGGVKRAIEKLPIIHKVMRVPTRLVATYADVEGVKRLLDQFDVSVEDEQYGREVVISCAVPEPEWEAFGAAVGNATSGRATVEQTGDARAD